MTATGSSFYVTGGSLRGDAPSYVPRHADRELYERLRDGEFCYVLTSRQMGKSSLMVRTAARLRLEGVQFAVVDLTAIGQSVTPEQWYHGILTQLGKRLDLEDELDDFWDAGTLGPLQRWAKAIEQIVLPRCSGRLVIFIDEIDVVRSLPFSTDEFFAAIREFHNRRAQDASVAHLTFCLLGVATPSDLCQNPKTTPFNIGRRIELPDFSWEEATPLAAGLSTDPATGKRLLRRILDWTGGQPYLTQRLCQALVESPGRHTPRDVDRLCRRLFLARGARERDDNLANASLRLLKDEIDPAILLDLYGKARRGLVVRDDPSPAVAVLKLSGLVRADEGRLVVRNRIYRQAFDRKWIRSNLPGAELRRQWSAFRRGLVRASLVASLLMAVMLGAGYGYWDGYLRVKEEYYASYSRVWGVPKGVGPLTPVQAAHRSSVYKFYKRARVVERVDTVRTNGDGSADRFSTEIDVAPWLDFAHDEALWSDRRKPCRWEFVRDAEGNLVFETAFDRNGRRTSTLLYAPGDDRQQVIAHYIDESGRPVFRRSAAAVYLHIKRTTQGFDEEVLYYDKDNQPVSLDTSAWGARYEHDSQGQKTKVINLNASGEMSRWSDGCCVESYGFDNLFGLISKRGDLNQHGQPNIYHDGTGGYLVQRDEWGRSVDEAYFDLAGQATHANKGYARDVHRYNEHGDQIEVAYFDEKKQPVLHKEGHVKAVSQFDDRGRKVETRYYLDQQQTPAFHADGYHGVFITYNGQDDLIQRSYFGADGKLAVRKGGYAGERNTWSTDGLLTETTYTGIDEKPIRIADGYVRITRTYDPHGRQIEEEYWGYEGVRARHTNGYSRWRGTRDERGNLVRQAYFDELNNPIADQNGVAIREITFDLHGKEVGKRYLDAKGQPVMNSDEGRASYRAVFAFNSMVEERSFDIQGKPIRDRWGSSLYKIEEDEVGNDVRQYWYNDLPKDGTLNSPTTYRELTYDRFRNVVEQRSKNWDTKALEPSQYTFLAEYDRYQNQTRVIYLDSDGKPGTVAMGYASVRRKHDPHGRVIEESYWDEQNQQDTNEGSTHHLTVQFDRLGNKLREEFFDKGGVACAGPGGWARIEREYDLRGHLVDERKFRPADSTAEETREVTHVHYVRDRDGNILEQSHFSANGQRATEDGFARMTATYNIRGQVLKQAYFGLAGEPVMGSSAGYSLAEYQYNALGLKTAEQFFYESDGVSRPTHQEEWSYDAQGRLTTHLEHGFDLEEQGYVSRKVTYLPEQNREKPASEQFLDDKAQPVARREDGIAEIRRKFDAGGRLIEEACFDPAGMPTLNNSGDAYDRTGFARQVWEYDIAGKELRHLFYDTTDKLVFIEQWDGKKIGYAERTREERGSGGWMVRLNDSRGNPLEEYWLDADEKPSNPGYGDYFRVIYSYDDDGRETEVSYLDGTSRLINGPDGFARRTTVYDPRGNQIELAYYDSRNRPVLGDDSYARRTATYDEQSRETAIAYFGAVGNPVRGPGGFARCARTFSVGLLAEEEKFFGVDDRPLALDAGYAAIRRKLNEKGQVLELGYFDADDKPVDSTEGFARVTQQFDPQGRCLERAFFDKDAAPVVVAADSVGLVDLGGVFARWTARYDERGNLLEEAFFGSAGQPIIGRGEYARLEQTFDESGHCLSRRYYGEDGGPFRLDRQSDYRNSLRLAQRALELGALPLAEGKAEAKASSEPASITADQAQQRVDRDAERHVRNVYDYLLDPVLATSLDNLKFDRIAFEYDAAGELLADVIVTENIEDKEFTLRREFSGCRATALRWLSAAGAPAVPQIHPVHRFAVAFTTYEEDPAKLSRVYQDDQGKPATVSQGYASLQAELDVTGQPLKVRYFNADGKPFSAPQGWAGISWTREELLFDVPDPSFLDEKGAVLTPEVVVEYASANEQYNTANLQQGDALLKFAGTELKTVSQLRELLPFSIIDRAVEASRNGDPQTMAKAAVAATTELTVRRARKATRLTINPVRFAADIEMRGLELSEGVNGSPTGTFLQLLETGYSRYQSDQEMKMPSLPWWMR